jgi:hypothetical protein
MKEEIIDLGSESKTSEVEVKREKRNVDPWDIFKLAKGILITSTVIYLVLAMIRIFYSDHSNDEGIKEVWEYSKVLLNSIVSLVLGLYFGSRHENKSA